MRLMFAVAFNKKGSNFSFRRQGEQVIEIKNKNAGIEAPQLQQPTKLAILHFLVTFESDTHVYFSL